MEKADINPEWKENTVRAQLERILGHPEFHATGKMRDFLRFVVEQTLAGNARQLKGFTIATEVFGRDEDFDAANDPVVRIQAGRLRRAIERYYLVAGGRDPIHIDIPKGGYVPVFNAGPITVSKPDTGKRPTTGPGSLNWPRILVLPFEDMTGDSEFAYFGPGLATELCIGLGHCPELRVMLSPQQVPVLPKAVIPPDFMVRGSVHRHGDDIKVMVQLIAADSGEQLWVDSLKMAPNDDSLISFQENAGAAITAHIAGAHGAIFRALSRPPNQQPTSKITCYQAILKGHAYHQKVDAASYSQAFVALKEAHSRDPGCGLACTMLALLYADNLAMEFFDIQETPIEEAVRLAREGVRLEPNHQLSRIILARVLLLKGNLEAGHAEIEKALALHPESLLFLDVIGYMLVLLGDWQRGEELIFKSIRLNPYYRILTRYAIWLNAFRQADYEKALAESERLVGVGYFWGPLIRAVTFGALGHEAERQAAIEKLLELKPDFPQRGRALIERFVKFPELRQRIVGVIEDGGLVLQGEAD